MLENEISYQVRGAIFEVYNQFGPGLLESVYKQALHVGLIKKGLSARNEVGIGVEYENCDLGLGFRIDLLVEEKLILEVKSVEMMADVHHKQVLTYLKLTGCRLGILVNFNTSDISSSIVRIVNNLE
jgi:GxxExxY protein